MLAMGNQVAEPFKGNAPIYASLFQMVHKRSGISFIAAQLSGYGDPLGSIGFGTVD
jgi:hypothetical protein